jgi:hypothetical protein
MSYAFKYVIPSITDDTAKKKSENAISHVDVGKEALDEDCVRNVI